MRAAIPRSREEWFIPHAMVITLPNGREIIVDGIPYEGWGTTPGKIYRITEHDDDGNIIAEQAWSIPLDET